MQKIMKERKINNKILDFLVKSLILDVTDKYLMKVKKEKKNPPEIIEKYFSKAVFLSKQKKIKIKKIKNNLRVMNEEYKNDFIKLIKSDEEYFNLFKELNFTYFLIRDEKLQEKIINELYSIFIKSNQNYESINKQKEKIFNFNWMFKFNKNNNFSYY